MEVMHFLYLPCGISTDLPRKLNLLFIFGLLSFGEGGLMKILHVLNRGGGGGHINNAIGQFFFNITVKIQESSHFRFLPNYEPIWWQNLVFFVSYANLQQRLHISLDSLHFDT
jgi:hypothetical protein